MRKFSSTEGNFRSWVVYLHSVRGADSGGICSKLEMIPSISILKVDAFWFRNFLIDENLFAGDLNDDGREKIVDWMMACMGCLSIFLEDWRGGDVKTMKFLVSDLNPYFADGVQNFEIFKNSK